MNDWQIGMQMMSRAPAPIPLIEDGDEPQVFMRPDNEVQSLVDMYAEGFSVCQLSTTFKRSKTFIIHALVKRGVYTQKRAADRTKSVIDMLKRGKYTAIQVAAAESISLDYVREVIQRINGVQRRRVGTTYQYWIEA